MESQDGSLIPENIIKAHSESNGSTRSSLEDIQDSSLAVNKLDIRQNGHIEVLKKVVVQIERLRDVDKPLAQFYPLKMSESPKKKEAPPKKFPSSSPKSRGPHKRTAKPLVISDPSDVLDTKVLPVTETHMAPSLITDPEPKPKVGDLKPPKKERKHTKSSSSGSDILGHNDQKPANDHSTPAIDTPLVRVKRKYIRRKPLPGKAVQATPRQKRPYRRRKDKLEGVGIPGEEGTPRKKAKREGIRKPRLLKPGKRKSSTKPRSVVMVPPEHVIPIQTGSGSGKTGSGIGQSQNSSQATSASGSFSASQGETLTGGSYIMGGGGGGDAGGGREGGSGNNGVGVKKEPVGGKIQELKPCKLLGPKYVIRPAPIPPAPEYVKIESGDNHVLNKDGWLAVFARLHSHDLVQCLKVCKTWYRWALKGSLWKKIDLSLTRIKQVHLIGIVKRQPQVLNLSYTNISYQQMSWLIARLPHLKVLNLTGNSWAAVSALCTSCCPLLQSLNLSWVSHLQTKSIKELLYPPSEHRPGIDDSTSRFRSCTELILTGSDVTDATLPTIHLNLPKIEKLGLSCCTLLTDSSVETIAKMDTLKELDISKCTGMTSAVFESLQRLKGGNLKMVNVQGIATNKRLVSNTEKDVDS